MGITFLQFFPHQISHVLSWCFGGRDIPVLIPNTAVKSSSTDGTRMGRVGRRQDKVCDLKIWCGTAVCNQAKLGQTGSIPNTAVKS